MKGIAARLWIVAAGSLLSWAEAGLCRAEDPAPGLLANPSQAPADSTAGLPSTVSPAIERFVRQARRDVPPSSPPATAPMPITSRNGDDPIGPLPPLPGEATPGGAANGTNPLATGMALREAPTRPSDRLYPINLATALRLADARPLIVAAAQAGVWVAEADLTRAKVLWVPTLRFGFDYLRHEGGGPDFNKGIMTAPSVNYFMGGAGANLYINVTDAIYEPLVSRQVLNARNWDVQAAKNDATLKVADAYFRVHQARGRYAGALYSVERGRLLTDRIASLTRELVPAVEADRSRNVLADLQQRAAEARREWQVASADLTQVLRLDPRAVVEPLEHDHAQVTLVDPGRPLEELMAVALTNRPELASRRTLVQAAETRVRREKNRPLLPNVLVDGFQTPGMLLQAGIFAIGPNSSLNQWRGRQDVSLQLIWQLENFGIGNLARIKAARGNQSRSIVELRDAQDAAAADVTRALARVQSAAARTLQADGSLRTAIITFNGHLEGLGQTRRFGDVLVLTFRPQEAVYSLQQVYVSFAEYFDTVSEYNRAQFELFHALGYPAQEVAVRQVPGQVLPVDTTRPPYLPPVGNGPPPATR